MQHGLKIAQYVVFCVVYPLKICLYFIGFLTPSLNLDEVNLEILRLYLQKVVEMQISKRKTPANAGVLFWWSRGEFNPCPKAHPRGLLRAQFVD